MSDARIVSSAPVEPDANELERKQMEILERLRSVTPDQLAEFRARTLDTGRADEVKAMWSKTIWAK